MDAVERYIRDHTPVEEELLRELDRETNLRAIHPRMLSGHLQGQLLAMLVRIVRPSRVLEIGTFTGYSALCMAAAMEKGSQLHTLEIEDELQELAQSFFYRSVHGEKIHLHIGPALDIAPTLAGAGSGAAEVEGGAPTAGTAEGGFDLVFIDGDKREYPAYYRMLMGDGGGRALVRSGSVIVADNILWSGKVARPVAHNDSHTQALVEFNRMVADDRRVQSVILPLRDGLSVIRVK